MLQLFIKCRLTTQMFDENAASTKWIGMSKHKLCKPLVFHHDFKFFKACS